LSPDSPAAAEVGVNPAEATRPAADGARADGRTKVGGQLADGLMTVPVGVGDDVGDIDGDNDPE
jgi:hypothetical protein